MPKRIVIDERRRHGPKSAGRLSGRRDAPAEWRRLLARSLSYASAPRSLSAKRVQAIAAIVGNGLNPQASLAAIEGPSYERGLFRTRKDRPHVKLRTTALIAFMLLGGCRHAGEITDENGGGIYAVRSVCPVAGIPAGTGDITLFNPPSSRDSAAIDVTASISQLRSTCEPGSSDVVSNVTFTVSALRSDSGPARQVILPYFDVALRGGTNIEAKQVGSVALNFPAGSQHAITRAEASIRVSRYAATLPARVRAVLTRPRKAGQADAAVDPMSDPAVREAVANATFEHLVGFELTQDQLKYNATR